MVARILKSLALTAWYALLLATVLALWDSDAPQFVYVAF